MNDSNGPREIDVRICTSGGHEYTLRMPENSTELRDLFAAFVHAGAHPGRAHVQLPLEGGKTALTIAAQHIVSVVTSPPVLVELPISRRIDAPVAGEARLRRPSYAVIDDFLSPDEHREMLALALRDRHRFIPGTVAGERRDHRRNSVIMDFATSAHSALITNRLLVWLPIVAEAVGEPFSPLAKVETQLTASNDGDYYRGHLDSGADATEPRMFSCVYYFFREPKGFTGGSLRLHDTLEQSGEIQAAESFREVAPLNNRLVVFTSRTFHELRPLRCPSKDFADSRFAITMWLHRRPEPDPGATFGWGHFHCGEVPEAFRTRQRA